jgi:hypothetical protein
MYLCSAIQVGYQEVFLYSKEFGQKMQGPMRAVSCVGKMMVVGLRTLIRSPPSGGGRNSPADGCGCRRLLV